MKGADKMNKPIGLYIHIPFCRHKCPYCDFYSVTASALIDEYINAVIRNISNISDYYTFDSVYFGGGTPSLLTPLQVRNIVSKINVTDYAEISMECNPESSDSNKLSAFRKAGINRISFGVQSLSDTELKHLGRIHNAETAERAIYSAYDAGFDNISADLMLGICSQTLSSAKETVNILTSFPLTHISAYMLKIEKGTPYYNDTVILQDIPDEDTTCDIYLNTISMLKEKSFVQYEISNFSKPGYECRHNLKYWLCEDYYGVGPGAHSCINNKRFYVEKDIHKFISSQTQETVISDENACGFFEQAMLRLRLKDGISMLDYPEHSERILNNAQPLIRAGLVKHKGNNILITEKGYLVSNEIICRLLDED